MTISKKLFLFAACIICGTIAQAQVKLGHINSTTLLSAMPETKVADSTLQKFGESLQAQLKTMTAEYDSKVADYQAKAESMAGPVKDTKEKEIRDDHT